MCQFSWIRTAIFTLAIAFSLSDVAPNPAYAAQMCASECNRTCDATTPSRERAAACKIKWACAGLAGPCNNKELVNLKIAKYKFCKKEGRC